VIRRWLILLTVPALVAGAASKALATDWVLARDFSTTANPNGQWTYGVYVDDGAGYLWYTWERNYDWAGLEGRAKYWGIAANDLAWGAVFYTTADKAFNAGTQWWAPHKVMLQPGYLGALYAPVVRWTAPADMQVSVDARFHGCEDVTTDVHILLNGDMSNGPVYTGTHLLDGLLDGNYGYAPLGIAATGTSNHLAYKAVLDLNAGDRLDFVVGPNGWHGHDLTGLDVTITGLADIPQPADWVLDRDFAKGSNPHRQWTYGVYLDDANPDTWYTWPDYYVWPNTVGGIGYWGNPNGDLGAGCIFYTNSDAPVVGSPNQWFAPHKVMLQPACWSSYYAPVVRWTAPADMKVSLDASFYGCEETSTDVHILLNGDMHDGPVYTGTSLLDGLVTGNYGYDPLGIAATHPDTNHVACSAVLDLRAGDRLDFVVGANGWCGHDLTGLDVTITPLCHIPWADMDGDQDVDQDDFEIFQECFTGPTAVIPPQQTQCYCVDRAGSAGQVTIEDLIAFMACWTGPGVPSAGCP
jgi:hypothetical protein